MPASLTQVLEQLEAEAEATWTDTGLDAFEKAMQELEKVAIKLGVVGDAALHPALHDPSITLGDLALMLEYGTSTIPARPFVNGVISPREALDELARVARSVVSGNAPENGLKQAGENFAHRLRENILANEDILPNAPETVRRKGFDHPLLDTGQLVQSIGYELVYPGEATVSEE